MIKPKKKTVFIALGTLSIFLLVTALGGIGFIYSGLYDISARHPHQKLMRIVLLATKRRSVEFHARNLKVPELNDETLIKHGVELYQNKCLACHGAPGVSRLRLGIGLNPNPPPLEKAAEDWTPAEIGWMIANGLKMAGMPAFGIGLQSEDLWALTAFVVRMNTLSPAEYAKMLSGPEHEVQWTIPDGAWKRLEAADEKRGQKLLKHYGCASCHEIPGINGPQGKVGPSLRNWRRRHYISGRLVNNPKNLLPWIMDPQSIEPGTAMPNLNVSEKEALHMAKFLYSIDK